MNARFWTLATIMALGACSGPDKDTDTDPTPTPGPTGDTFVESFLEPDFGIFAASFGYDMANDQATGTDIGGNVENPAVLFILFTQNWSGSLSDTDNACVAAAVTDTTPRDRADWVADFAGQLFGFDYGAFEGVQDGCEGELDPDDYPDFAATMAQGDWAVSVAAEMNQTYYDRLIGAGVPAADLADNIGGGFHGSVGATFSESGLLQDVITAGFEVNDSMVATLSGQDLTPLTPAQMVVDDALQRGYYSIQLNVPVSAVDAFF